VEAPTTLILNPGSTSTKIAYSVDGKIMERETFHHSSEELQKFSTVWDQFEFRLALCRWWAENKVQHCSAVVAIGGLLKPVQGGTYCVNRSMLRDARGNFQGEHISNIGCALAAELAQLYDCEAFVVDPVSVDEFGCLAYYSGHPAIKRRSLSHALNIHATARRAAREMELKLEQSSFVVAHVGGGISIAPVIAGRIVDANDAASDGPFSPERSGGLPLQQLLSICFAENKSESDIRRMVMGRGGLVGYLGVNSVEEVERRVKQGDVTAEEVYRAMAYQISKEIGAMTTVLSGNVDAIIITGGAANSPMLTAWIEERVRFIARVIIYPGDDEMQALADGALRVVQGIEQAKEY